MRRRRLIRCFWIVAAVAATLEVLALVLLLRLPRPLADSECSELYRRYADLPGIRASYVKNFHLSDTLTVDVTLLEATDSASWEMLRECFHFDPPHPLIQNILDRGKDVVSLRKSNANHPELPLMDKKGEINPVAMSPLNHTITIFHTHNWEEEEAAFYNQCLRDLPKN